MKMTDNAASPPDPAPSLSVIRRLLAVFFDPKAAFQAVVARPSWVWPLALICVSSLGTVTAISRHIGWQSIIERQAQKLPMVQHMTPEQKAVMLDRQLKLAPVIAYFGAVVSPILGAAALAGLFLLVFNFLADAKTRYTTSLGIVAHAWLPLVISNLLGTVVIFLVKEPSLIDPQNLLGTNASALFSDNSPAWLLNLVRSFDVITLWVIVLLAIGYSTASPKKLSFISALSSILGLWFVLVSLRVAIAATFL
jgi:hypothetical protein